MPRQLYKVNLPGGYKRYIVASDHREVDNYLEKAGITWNSYTCEAGDTPDAVRNNRQLIIL